MSQSFDSSNSDSFNSQSVVSLNPEEVEKILQTVEGLDPVGSQLDQVGPYGIQQIRQAIAQKAMDCVDPMNIGSFALVYQGEKQLFATRGKAILHVMYPPEALEANRDLYLPEWVELSILSLQVNYVLEFEYTYFSESELDVRIRYADYRLPYRRRSSRLEQVQHKLVGLRWMAANLRRWKELPDRVILPEEI